MRNFKFLLALLSISFLMHPTFAQKVKITSAQISLQEGKTLDAKKEIDEALASPEIQQRSDAWQTKGDVYKAIYEGKVFYAQNPNCLFDAKDAYLKAAELELNPKKQKKIYPSLEMMYSYLFNVGFERFNAKKYDDAFKHFKASQDVDQYLFDKGYKASIDTNNIFAAGIAAANANLIDDAINYLQKAADLNYDNVAIYETLVQLYEQKKQPDAVKKIVAEGLKKYPTSKNLQIYELNASLDAGDLSASIAKFEEAVKNDPNNSSILFNLAALYDKNGDRDKAIANYENAIKVNPTFGDAYFNLGVLYFNEGVQYHKQMNAIDYKDDPTGAKSDALKAKRDEIFKKALPYLEKAYEIDPTNADYKANLKKVYASMNMLDKAKALGN
ncbi:MAG: tetratricopeptide repeat protein [Chitinophagales bacterium]|nr:tetratricopeptide repeat protein [Bacteroidota bacterium]